MSRLRSHLTYANVMSTLAVVLVIGGGAAYAANTIISTDIVNNEVYGADVRDDTLAGGGLGHVDLKAGSVRSSEVGADSLTGADIANETLGSADIANGQLNDEDIAQGTFVNLEAVIGNVPANSCRDRRIIGAGALGDHLLLTARWGTSNPDLNYTAKYDGTDEAAVITVCNPTNAAIDDGNTHFNLLVTDAY